MLFCFFGDVGRGTVFVGVERSEGVGQDNLVFPLADICSNTIVRFEGKFTLLFGAVVPEPFSVV